VIIIDVKAINSNHDVNIRYQSNVVYDADKREAKILITKTISQKLCDTIVDRIVYSKYGDAKNVVLKAVNDAMTRVLTNDMIREGISTEKETSLMVEP